MLNHQLLNVQITTHVEIGFKIANEFIMQVAFLKKKHAVLTELFCK